MNGSYQGMADLFSGLLGMNGYAKSTIQHARDNVADMTEPGADAISREVVSGDGQMDIDETPVRGSGGTGYVWVAADDAPTMVRAAAVL